MKNLNYLNEFRVLFPDGNNGDEFNGAFNLKIKGESYFVIAGIGYGWEHVSISHKHKIPSWSVMCILKDMFFNDDEVVMQLHVAKKDHINIATNCLHLWRPLDKEIPLPPKKLV